jgi:hypothetical protein
MLNRGNIDGAIVGDLEFKTHVFQVALRLEESLEISILNDIDMC